MKRIAYLIAGLMLATAAVAAETPKTAATPTVKDKAMQQLDAQIAKAKPDKAKAGWRTTLSMPDTLDFDPAHTYYARMVTNKGTILIKFMPQIAPVHVTSFAYLAKLGFYDGLTFHRVITGFMAQGGCPLGTGSVSTSNTELRSPSTAISSRMLKKCWWCAARVCGATTVP